MRPDRLDEELAFQFQAHLLAAGGKEDTIRDMLVTTFRMELGSRSRPLRWPEQPAFQDWNYKTYCRPNDENPCGADFLPNRLGLPPDIDIPEISTEDAAQITGRETGSVSVMAEQCYAISANFTIRSDSLGATPSVRGTPVPGPSDPFADQPSTPTPQQRKVRKTKAELMKNINQLNLDDPTLEMTPTGHRHRKGGSSGADQNLPQQVPRLRLQSEPQQHLPQQSGPRQRATSQDQPARHSPLALRPVQIPPQLVIPPFRAQQAPVPPAPQTSTQRRETSSRHYVERSGYALRDRNQRGNTPAPEVPDWDDIWRESHHAVVIPNIDDDFQGWQYEMAKERWDREHQG
ncbi:hypothetical protein F5883DRAFT_573286 [Diaporthe sp. PMI_573]|nr:hypothetical protein F5883DRAFT_573286 [Diaporthaceae sp. PMI_573]